MITSQLAATAFENQDLGTAIDELSQLLSTSPMNLEWRLQRADCYLKLKDIEMAIADLSKAVQIKPDAKLYLQLSQLHVQIDELPKSLIQIKECLRLDPDHKECKKQFKYVKKLTKAFQFVESRIEKKKWRDALQELIDEELIQKVQDIGASSMKKRVYEWACLVSSQLKKDDALDWCTKTLELDENNLNALLGRAQVYMKMEEYQQGLIFFMNFCSNM